MSNLKPEHLAEVTELLNRRIEEFEIVSLPTITPGLARLAFDAIEEWMARTDYLGDDSAPDHDSQAASAIGAERARSESIDTYAMTDAYHFGYERGREAMRRELLPALDGAKDTRLVTNSAPEPSKNEAPVLNPDSPDGRWQRFLSDMDDAIERQRTNGHQPDSYTDGAPCASLDADHVAEAAVHQEEEVAWDFEDTTANIEALVSASVTEDNVQSKPETELPVDNSAAIGVSDQVAATPGPENVVVTPEKSPLPPLPAPRAAAATGPSRDEALDGINGAGERSFLWQVIDVLREIAVGGIMPTKGFFNENKPYAMLSADGVLARLKLGSWGDLANRATLAYDAAAHKKAEFEEIVALIKKWADEGDGTMLTMAEWDVRKPEHLPKATLLNQRHNTSWGDIAQIAKLELAGRRNRQPA